MAFKPEKPAVGAAAVQAPPPPAARKEEKYVASPGGIYPRGSVAAIVLGGGESDAQMVPLTLKRALAAVPLAGSYRLIDVPLSSLVNSGVNKIWVLTQYNSHSLNRHLSNYKGAYLGHDGFVDVLAATVYPDVARWSNGTADAVASFHWLLESQLVQKSVQDVLVLPTDQVYRLDWSRAVQHHRETNADLTILSCPVPDEAASQFGCLKVDDSFNITHFYEKPRGPSKELMRMDKALVKRFMSSEAPTLAGRPKQARDAYWWAAEGERVTPHAPPEVPDAPPATKSRDRDGAGAGGGREVSSFLGSCGMYIFKRSVLASLLKAHRNGEQQFRDFGRDLIPHMLEHGYVVRAHPMNEWWVDVGGSIRDFWQANLELLDFEFTNTNANWPIYREQVPLPSTHFGAGAHTRRSLIGHGCQIGAGAHITASVLGNRSILGAQVEVTESIVMGADFYEDKAKGELIPIGIGEGTHIVRTIVDKNARVGKNCRLLNKEGVRESQDRAGQGIYIRDGIIALSKGAVIPDGTCV